MQPAIKHRCFRELHPNPPISHHFSSDGSVQQRFSLPRDVMYYVLNNSEITSKIYYKLYFSCKQFFTKTKVVSCCCMAITPSNVLYSYDRQRTEFPIDALLTSDLNFSVNRKLFIVERSNYNLFEAMTFRFIAPIPKIDLEFVNLSLKELEFVGEKTEALSLYRCVFEDSKGSVIPVEEIFKHLPNVIDFRL